MPFLLDGNPTTSEISDAVNYVLSNFNTSYTADPNTGQISGPTGEVQGYLYQYMAIKYADSFDGSVNFSNVPTNRQYFGIRNNADAAESSNPVDYIWTKATGGFGVTKSLWYLCTGGRQIQFAVATAAPDAGWLVDPGASIDLDVVTSGNIPVIAETFFSYFTPATMQVPRTGNPLSPVFTNVTPVMFSTDGGVVIPFTDAQTDSNVGFVNNSWRIGNSATTGYGDISYTNITIGNPTDAGDYALWPAPTAMSASPAYINVPVRYKNSLGVVTQASVARLQLVFSDPGADGLPGSSIDISGYTSFTQNPAGAFTPTTATLTAVLVNITSPTYSWTISGATPTSATTASVVVTPTSSSTGVTVTLTVNGSNLLSPISKTVKLPVVYDGIPGVAGANGIMSAFPSIYLWTGAPVPPTRPSTTSTYTWATGAYTAPSGWSTDAPTNTTAGNYLWEITIPLNVVATTTTSTLDWTNTSYPIRAIAYNGNNGNNGTNGSATFVVDRGSSTSNASPSDAECIAVIGRTPVAGDICTVSYNNNNNATVWRYTSGSYPWILQTTYITGSLIVQNTITGDKISANTITGTNIAGATITGSKIAAGTITATNIAANTITANEIATNTITVDKINNVATGQIIAGSFNFIPYTSSGTWTVPAYVYKVKVTVIGAGGGGGLNSGFNSSAGGAGGGAIKVFTVNPSDVYTITVGNGGAPGATGGYSRFTGNAGTVTANGGGPPSGLYNQTPGPGGTATGGDINITGGAGQVDQIGGFAGLGGSAPFIGVNGASGVTPSPNSGSGGAFQLSGGSGLVIVEF